MHSNFTRRKPIARLAVLALLALCFVQTTVRAQGTTECVLDSAPLGLTLGQTLRFSPFNPNQRLEGHPQRQTVLVQVALRDARGNLIAHSQELALPPGEFRSIDFNRDSLHLAGEPGTGRVQVRAEVRYRFLSIVDRTQILPGNFPAALELVDNSNGSTTLMLPAVQKVREFEPNQ